MYKKSIKENSKFLVPFVEGVKYYGYDEIEHGLGTMIILNKHGDILTCSHIARRFIDGDIARSNYLKFKSEYNNAKDKDVIKKKYHINDDSVVLNIINLSFNGRHNFKIIFHKYLDLAIIRFDDVKIKLEYYPIFSNKLPEIGQSICKLGFAFPEYDMFCYDKIKDEIILKDNVKLNFPIFPFPGIVTRYIMNDNGDKTMFETSSMGIRGQSGGPIFSPEGIIYGIQSMTKLLDLNLDVYGEFKRGVAKKKIEYTPLLPLGVGVASTEIIKFLKDNSVEFMSK